MTREELMQDLAYARTLAEEGRHAPLLGGAYLMFWGVLNALAFSLHRAALAGQLPELNGWIFALIWAGYGVIAGMGMYALRQRMCEKPGRATIGVRAERAVWGGAGIALLAVVIGSLARMLMTNDPTAPNAIFGAAFAIYGAALFAVAALSEQGWMRRFAWLSIGFGLTLCLFANDDWAYIYAAIGSLLVLAWPGAILLKREPSAIV
ncbi:hypothetical protein [Vitreimonas sp.]|uniref:hypothetical protein n=1 Tax=Vitreimonas sp. TaxID=3069702 RepID=UPI002ED9DBDC